MSDVPKPPEILDKIVDKVLAYRRPKTKIAKKRKKAEKKRGKPPCSTSPATPTSEQ